MDTQPLKLKIDSGQAQADLAALARALDSAGAAAGRMSAGLTSGMAGADRAIKGSMSTMERFAQTAGLINKIKVNGDSVKGVNDFVRAMNAASRAKEIENAKLNSWRKFIEMGALTSRLRMDPASSASLMQFVNAMDRASKARDISAAKMASWVKFTELATRASHLRGGGAQAMVGMNMFAQAMDNASRARAIPQAKLKSWVDFITVAARVQNLKFNPQVAQALRAFGDSLTGLKAPGKASIERLDKLFQVLANAKRIPSAVQIARDLDMVAAAAGRASHALDRLPMRLRASMGGTGGGMGRMMRETAAGADSAGKSFNSFGNQAESVGKRTYTLGERLRGLNHRFDLAYQAGTAFSLLFSSFTIGGMIKSVYDVSVEMLKLDKAMLFSTKSFEGSKRASAEFIATVFDMGLALNQVAEPFGRFTISAGAAGMSAQDSASIFKSVTQTLQVVGASAEQTGYAMYGLTQMIQKGKVSSEEFNRQIGEQIPGNAEAGRRALEKMTGQAVTMQQFFKKMATGTLESSQFTKLWAAELDAMFGDLMVMVRDRPDVAINRLSTAMTMFKVAVGKNQFVQEIGIQFSRLANMIAHTENGVFKLRPKFQDLADKLGRNLADAMRTAGDLLVWLVDNFDKVAFAAKTVATLFIARTFLSWGQAAFNTASSIQSLTKALFGLKIAQDAVASSDLRGAVAKTAQSASSSQAARAAATAGSVAVTGADMRSIQVWRNSNGFAPGYDQRPQVPVAMPPSIASFGRRQEPPRPFNPQRTSGATTAVLAQRGDLTRQPFMARLGGSIASAGSTAMAVAPSAASAALKGLAVVGKTLATSLGVLGIAAVGVGTALTILSDKMTKVQGVDMRFEDITSGALDMIARRLTKWFSDFISDGASTQEALNNLGDYTKAAVDALIWFGEVIGDTVGVVIHFGDALIKALSGDLAGAGRSVGRIGQDWSDNNIFDANVVQQRKQESFLSALEASNERREREYANAAAEARTRGAAAALAQQQAAADQLKAAQMQVEAASEMTKRLKAPSVNEVLERGRRLASGAYAAANPSQTAEQRAAANAQASLTLPSAAAPASTSKNDVGSGLIYRQSYGGKEYTATSQEELTRVLTAAIRATDTANPEQQRRADSAGMLRTLGGLAGLLVPGVGRPINTAANAYADRLSPPGSQDSAETRARRLATSAARQELDRRDAERGSSTDMAMQLLREREGLILRAQWDVNHQRVGYGSDTKTDARTGQVTRVQAGTTVTVEDAEADLRRRTLAFQAQAAGEIGKQNWDGLTAAAQAALTSVIYNYGTLDRRNGRGAGIADDIRGGATSPEEIARLVEGLAGHNNGVNRSRRMQEASIIRGGVMVGGKDVPTSAAGAVAQAAEEEKKGDLTSRASDWKSMMSLITAADPASQALFQVGQVAAQAEEIFGNEEERVKKWGADAVFVTEAMMDMLEKKFKSLAREAADAMNPVAKGNRELRDQNQILGMVIQGKSKEAEWQEKLNGLREQYGEEYLAMMQDAAKWEEHVTDLQKTNQFLRVESLETSRKEWEIQRERGLLLQDELRLMQTINEARLRGAAPTSSRRDMYLNDLINQTQEGGTLEQKRANLSPERLGTLELTADVQFRADKIESLQGLIAEASDSIRRAGMSATKQAFDQTYMDILRSMTGMANASLAEITEALNKAGDTTTDRLATQYAKLREELENPPGFQRWVNALEPLEQRMQSIKGQFLDGLSEGITGELMGDDVDWGSIWKQIRREMTKASVDQAVGDVMGLFGIKRGNSGLSPESQALVTAMEGQRDDLRAMLKADGDRLVELLAGREDAMAAETASRNEQLQLVKEQVGALRIAADSLKQIADGLSGGVVRQAFEASEMNLREQAMALESGGGYTASGAPIPNVSLIAPASQVTAAPAPFDVQATLDRVFNRLGLNPVNVTGATTDAADEAMIARAAASSMRLSPERAVQGALPTAPAHQGLSRDTSTLFQRVGRVFGQNWGGTETNVRNTTAAQASTAVTTGPMALAQGGRDGEDMSSSALMQAAQALNAVPAAFNGPVAAFGTHLETWGESLKKFEKAIALMAKLGAKGASISPSKAASLLGSDGKTFEGKPFAPDLADLYADGGYVSGRGGPRSDSINARLSNGEFVINAAATAQNRGLLEAINNGKAYASGGYVDGLPGYALGGFFSNIGGMFKPSNLAAGAKNRLFGEGGAGMSFGDMRKATLSGMFGKGKNGKYDGPMSWVGQLFGKGNSLEDRMGAGMQGLGQLVTLAELLKKPEAPEKLPDPVKGVIGEHRAVTVDATEIAAHENPIAGIIDMGMNMLTGGTWGKVAAYRQMASSAYGAIKNAFADGGYVSSSGAGAVNWASLPHYAEGTPNTSGGMPAVVHPNEAIIPLSGGRKVPVDMSGVETGGGSTQVTSNITIIAPNPDAFRQSQGSIQRQQNRDLKRASTRNLS